jgi:hypothetical protein
MASFDCLERWCAIDKSDELSGVKYDLIEKGYTQPVELRGIDTGHEVLQVIAGLFERKRCEDREDRAW